MQKISEITNFFRHYFLSRTEVEYVKNSMKNMNFTNATSLVALTLTHNDGIKDADLSNTLISAQDIKDFDATLQNNIAIKYCKNLETLLLPKTDKGVVNTCELDVLQSLSLNGVRLTHKHSPFLCLTSRSETWE